MLKRAAEIAKTTVSEMRSRIAKLAHHITKNGYAKTQSDAWKMAWKEVRKIVKANTKKEITIEDKLHRIVAKNSVGTWAWDFATSNLERVMRWGDKTFFSDKQLAKIEELYAAQGR